jgi:hypothetical protein
MCSWLHLADKNSPEHFCPKPGHPYCPEHTRLIEYINSLDDDWDEIDATHRAVCEGPAEDKRRS